MIKKKRFILFTVLSSSLLFSNAQSGDFDAFGKAFKKAVAKKKYEKVADMMQFEFSSWDWGYYLGQGYGGFENREEFLKIADEIFTQEVIALIKSEPYKKGKDSMMIVKNRTFLFFNEQIKVLHGWFLTRLKASGKPS